MPLEHQPKCALRKVVCFDGAVANAYCRDVLGILRVEMGLGVLEGRLRVSQLAVR